MSKYDGSCLCGAVKFSVDIEDKKADWCNCEMCRRWCAGPSVMVHGSAKPELADESTLGVYSSSEWGERCFCKTCGSSLFWRHKQQPFFGIAVDALDGAEDFVLSGEIFTDKRPGYYNASDKTTRMTSAEFWEMIQSQG